MNITAQELGGAILQLQHARRTTPWYRFRIRYRLGVMIETLMGLMDWMADKANQKSCGCAAHTDPGAN